MSTTRSPSRPEPVRVGVLDESELVRHGLAGMLRPHGARFSLRAVPDCTTAATLDVVLCDPFAGADTGDRLRRIAALEPARVLVFTSEDLPQRRHRAREAGAHGFLTKSATTRELIVALESVLRGDPVFAPPPVAEATTEFPGLSHRESQVLALIVEGLSNQEIAERIYVSVNSVKTYIRQVYSKTGATRRTQAVAWAHAHGWDDQPAQARSHQTS